MLLLAVWSAAGAGEPEQCRVVRFGVVGFSDVTAVTAITARVLQSLGYTPVTVNLSVPVIFASLQSNSLDVFLGNWMPAQEGDLAPYRADGSVEVLGPNLTNARFTLAVPAYLYAAGLTDFAAIQRFAPQLDSAIYGIEPGAAANRLVLGMIQSNAFGLGGFRLIESSEQGMLAELERAWRGHQPLVFVAWEPHPMNLRFEIRYLAGGERFFGPNFGSSSINTVTRAGLSAQCPNLGRLLHNLEFSVRGESEIMAAIIEHHGQPDIEAKAWLTRHPDDVRRWLTGIASFAGGPPTPPTTDSDAAAVSADRLQGWMVQHKIPLGDNLTRALDFFKTHGGGVFDAIAAVLRALLLAVNAALRAVPAWGLILTAAVLTGLAKRSWALTVFVPLALLFILNQGYWSAMLETLSLVLVATCTCVGLGVPLGIAAAHHPRLYATLRPVLDLMQTLPTFVYLIPTLVLFGLGPVPGLISTVIFALPAPVRLTQLGIATVPVALTEVGRAYGATGLQLLWKVELPAAAPLILAGISQCIMLSLSMVVVAALVGAGGLGVPVVRALNSVQVAMGFEAGLVIVLLAVLLERLLKTNLRA